MPDRKPDGPLVRPLFGAATTLATRLALLGCVFAVGAVGVSAYAYYHTPYWNRVGLAPDQPILFSHRHHAGELHIDCRFCHATVETSASAGMPTTRTCLICHSQLFRDAPMLRPVWASAARDVPLAWSRVTSMPDHVHFNHSIHVAKGIACTACHGDVSQMALTAKAQPLTMRECIACHRDPAPRQVAAARVFLPPQQSPREFELNSGPALPVIHPAPLTNCSTCHH